MYLRKTISIFITSILISIRLQAEEPAALPATHEAIQKQLLEMQKSIQEIQTHHQSEMDALNKRIADQQTEIESLKQEVPPPPPGPADILPVPQPITPGFATSDPALVPSENQFPTTDPSLVTDTPSAGPVAGLSSLPSGIGAGSGAPKGSYLNLSFDAIIAGAASTANDLGALEVGDHDPQQNGFNARNVELALDGAVDSYFEGFANIVFKLDNGNETGVEVEEAFGQTTSLPYGLQFKGGQFFSPFGRNNPMHPHAWDFVDAPLINGMLLGPDGLRGVGAQVAWVLPTPFYAQALFRVKRPHIAAAHLGIGLLAWILPGHQGSPYNPRREFRYPTDALEKRSDHGKGKFE